MRAGLNILVAGGTQRRASWYIENWTGQIPVALEHGVVLGAAGNGRVSAATRADFAASAAAVLTSQDQAGLVYELGGSPFTLAEYAAELSAQSGQPVSYQDLPTYEYAAVLVGAGLPEAFADQVEDVAGRKGNGRSGHAPRPRRHVQAGAAGFDDLEGHVVDRMPDWFPLAAKDEVQRPRRDQVTPPRPRRNLA